MPGSPETYEAFDQPLEQAVAAEIANRTENDLSHESRWARLKSSAAPVVREAIPIANRLRGRTDVDPADAFLQGVSFSEMNRQELAERSAFAQSMNNLDDQPILEKPKGKLHNWLLGQAAILAIFSSSNKNPEQEV